ncbi:hypothetical protein ACFVQ3_14500 [Oerskovia sp. NPDC057915]|uniref:hypothetical protein n=1 Tax=Oerskovia sp. NPDC057915 TaxID=3346280 RepID=UPI0036D8D7AA
MHRRGLLPVLARHGLRRGRDGRDVLRAEDHAKGQLVEARDPRIEAAGAPALITRYAYDVAGRLTTVTAPGEEPYSFAYGPGGASRTGSGDLIDAGHGRLAWASTGADPGRCGRRWRRPQRDASAPELHERPGPRGRRSGQKVASTRLR